MATCKSLIKEVLRYLTPGVVSDEEFYIWYNSSSLGKRILFAFCVMLFCLSLGLFLMCLLNLFTYMYFI